MPTILEEFHTEKLTPAIDSINTLFTSTFEQRAVINALLWYNSSHKEGASERVSMMYYATSALCWELIAIIFHPPSIFKTISFIRELLKTNNESNKLSSEELFTSLGLKLSSYSSLWEFLKNISNGIDSEVLLSLTKILLNENSKITGDAQAKNNSIPSFLNIEFIDSVKESLNNLITKEVEPLAAQAFEIFNLLNKSENEEALRKIKVIFNNVNKKHIEELIKNFSILALQAIPLDTNPLVKSIIELILSNEADLIKDLIDLTGAVTNSISPQDFTAILLALYDKDTKQFFETKDGEVPDYKLLNKLVLAIKPILNQALNSQDTKNELFKIINKLTSNEKVIEELKLVLMPNQLKLTQDLIAKDASVEDIKEMLIMELGEVFNEEQIEKVISEINQHDNSKEFLIKALRVSQDAIAGYQVSNIIKLIKDKDAVEKIIDTTIGMIKGIDETQIHSALTLVSLPKVIIPENTSDLDKAQIEHNDKKVINIAMLQLILPIAQKLLNDDEFNALLNITLHDSEISKTINSFIKGHDNKFKFNALTNDADALKLSLNVAGNILQVVPHDKIIELITTINDEEFKAKTHDEKGKISIEVILSTILLASPFLENKKALGQTSLLLQNEAILNIIKSAVDGKAKEFVDILKSPELLKTLAPLYLNIINVVSKDEIKFLIKAFNDDQVRAYLSDADDLVKIPSMLNTLVVAAKPILHKILEDKASRESLTDTSQYLLKQDVIKAQIIERVGKAQYKNIKAFINENDAINNFLNLTKRVINDISDEQITELLKILNTDKNKEYLLDLVESGVPLDFDQMDDLAKLNEYDFEVKLLEFCLPIVSKFLQNDDIKGQLELLFKNQNVLNLVKHNIDDTKVKNAMDALANDKNSTKQILELINSILLNVPHSLIVDMVEEALKDSAKSKTKDDIGKLSLNVILPLLSITGVYLDNNKLIGNTSKILQNPTIIQTIQGFISDKDSQQLIEIFKEPQLLNTIKPFAISLLEKLTEDDIESLVNVFNDKKTQDFLKTPPHEIKDFALLTPLLTTLRPILVKVLLDDDCKSQLIANLRYAFNQNAIIEKLKSALGDTQFENIKALVNDDKSLNDMISLVNKVIVELSDDQLLQILNLISIPSQEQIDELLDNVNKGVPIGMKEMEWVDKVLSGTFDKQLVALLDSILPTFKKLLHNDKGLIATVINNQYIHKLIDQPSTIKALVADKDFINQTLNVADDVLQIIDHEDIVDLFKKVLEDVASPKSENGHGNLSADIILKVIPSLSQLLNDGNILNDASTLIKNNTLFNFIKDAFEGSGVIEYVEIFKEPQLVSTVSLFINQFLSGLTGRDVKSLVNAFNDKKTQDFLKTPSHEIQDFALLTPLFTTLRPLLAKILTIEPLKNSLIKTLRFFFNQDVIANKLKGALGDTQFENIKALVNDDKSLSDILELTQNLLNQLTDKQLKNLLKTLSVPKLLESEKILKLIESGVPINFEEMDNLFKLIEEDAPIKDAIDVELFNQALPIISQLLKDENSQKLAEGLLKNPNMLELAMPYIESSKLKLKIAEFAIDKEATKQILTTLNTALEVIPFNLITNLYAKILEDKALKRSEVDKSKLSDNILIALQELLLNGLKSDKLSDDVSKTLQNETVLSIVEDFIDDPINKRYVEILKSPELLKRVNPLVASAFKALDENDIKLFVEAYNNESTQKFLNTKDGDVKDILLLDALSIESKPILQKILNNEEFKKQFIEFVKFLIAEPVIVEDIKSALTSNFIKIINAELKGNDKAQSIKILKSYIIVLPQNLKDEVNRNKSDLNKIIQIISKNLAEEQFKDLSTLINDDQTPLKIMKLMAHALPHLQYDKIVSLLTAISIDDEFEDEKKLAFLKFGLMYAKSIMQDDSSKEIIADLLCDANVLEIPMPYVKSSIAKLRIAQLANDKESVQNLVETGNQVIQSVSEKSAVSLLQAVLNKEENILSIDIIKASKVTLVEILKSEEVISSIVKTLTHSKFIELLNDTLDDEAKQLIDALKNAKAPQLITIISKLLEASLESLNDYELENISNVYNSSEMHTFIAEYTKLKELQSNNKLSAEEIDKLNLKLPASFIKVVKDISNTLIKYDNFKDNFRDLLTLDEDLFNLTPFKVTNLDSMFTTLINSMDYLINNIDEKSLSILIEDSIKESLKPKLLNSNVDSDNITVPEVKLARLRIANELIQNSNVRRLIQNLIINININKSESNQTDSPTKSDKSLVLEKRLALLKGLSHGSLLVDSLKDLIEVLDISEELSQLNDFSNVEEYPNGTRILKLEEALEPAIKNLTKSLNELLQNANVKQSLINYKKIVLEEIYGLVDLKVLPAKYIKTLEIKLGATFEQLLDIILSNPGSIEPIVNTLIKSTFNEEKKSSNLEWLASAGKAVWSNSGSLTNMYVNNSVPQNTLVKILAMAPKSFEPLQNLSNVISKYLKVEPFKNEYIPIIISHGTFDSSSSFTIRKYSLLNFEKLIIDKLADNMHLSITGCSIDKLNLKQCQIAKFDLSNCLINSLNIENSILENCDFKGVRIPESLTINNTVMDLNTFYSLAEAINQQEINGIKLDINKFKINGLFVISDYPTTEEQEKLNKLFFYTHFKDNIIFGYKESDKDSFIKDTLEIQHEQIDAKLNETANILSPTDKKISLLKAFGSPLRNNASSIASSMNLIKRYLPTHSSQSSLSSLSPITSPNAQISLNNRTSHGLPTFSISKSDSVNKSDESNESKGKEKE